MMSSAKQCLLSYRMLMYTLHVVLQGLKYYTVAIWMEHQKYCEFWTVLEYWHKSRWRAACLLCCWLSLTSKVIRPWTVLLSIRKTQVQVISLDVFLIAAREGRDCAGYSGTLKCYVNVLCVVLVYLTVCPDGIKNNHLVDPCTRYQRSCFLYFCFNNVW